MLIKARLTKGSSGGVTEGGAKEGGNDVDVKDTRSLISERERYQKEVDDTLAVLREIEQKYGVVVEDMLVATLRRGSNTLGYYDYSGNIAMNEKYWKMRDKLDGVYDSSVASGFHPSRGKKTGLQAIVAHELGHRVNYIAGGSNWNNLDVVAEKIVSSASKKAGYGNKVREFRRAVSGYGSYNNAEAVAEAFSDVYCNKRKASKESRAIVSELNKYFRKGKKK